MNSALPVPRWILVLCAAAVLLTQVLGLHHHRHLHPAGDAPTSGEWHFTDMGLHGDAGHAAHHGADHGPASAHGSGHHEQGASAHLHLDVDSDALRAGLAKVFVDAMLLALSYALLGLSSARRRQVPVRPATVALRRRRLHYALRPPSQAPPRHPVPRC